MSFLVRDLRDRCIARMRASNSRPPPPIDSTPDPPLQRPPLHERQLQVNPQKDSLLYNGTIPAELRDLIFFHSIQEYSQTDDSSIWHRDTKYTRPGYTSKRKINISLLLTCRRIYLETYHLPALKKEHVFWHSQITGPPHQRHHAVKPFGYDTEVEYFAKFQPWQLSLVKEIHLFMQMFWLEQAFLDFCKQDFMRGVELLKFTIRRGDWWWYESNHPLVISPYFATVKHDYCLALLHKDIEEQQRGYVMPWPNKVWGSAFKQILSLKELEIELETSDDKKHELDTIVKWAKTWKFPLNGGKVLSTEGLDVTSTSWQSPYCYWSHLCTYCGGHRVLGCNSEGTPNEEKCGESARLRSAGLGPKCHIYSLKWRVAQDVP
jgi:hypothetical protein